MIKRAHLYVCIVIQQCYSTPHHTCVMLGRGGCLPPDKEEVFAFGLTSSFVVSGCFGDVSGAANTLAEAVVVGCGGVENRDCDAGCAAAVLGFAAGIGLSCCSRARSLKNGTVPAPEPSVLVKSKLVLGVPGTGDRRGGVGRATGFCLRIGIPTCPSFAVVPRRSMMRTSPSTLAAAHASASRLLFTSALRPGETTPYEDR